LNDIAENDPALAKAIFAMVEDWIAAQYAGKADECREFAEGWPEMSDPSAIAAASAGVVDAPVDDCYFCSPKEAVGVGPTRPFELEKDRLCSRCARKVAEVLRGSGAKERVIRKLFPGLE